jgi:hypothetical protein
MISEIKERLSKIIREPWVVERRAGDMKIGVFTKKKTNAQTGCYTICHTKFHRTQDDNQALAHAEFIANAPADMEFLLGWIDVLAQRCGLSDEMYTSTGT